MHCKYETIIGLEVHVQLSTKTKQFCSCSVEFGKEPNSQVCPVCLGLPGVLPVLNEKSLQYSIKIALALKCKIQKIMKFDRKNYYYPDLPKAYQISQYDMPLAYNGKVTIVCDDEKGTKKDIGVTRAHMEEDAGKLLHDPNKSYSYVDLNRVGTALLEIVSEPEIETPDQAYKYLTNLKQIIKYLEVSDCNMEEGSLRCDANISLRERGEKKLGNKVEIKNLNSFKAVRDSLLFEENRQREILEEGGIIKQETRLWDEKKNVTTSMRSKEDTQDYRYFPEPDLVPFEIKDELIQEIRKNMPELPEGKAERFAKDYNLDNKDIQILISDKSIACFYEEVVKIFKDYKIVCNWIKGEILKHMNEKNLSINKLNITPQYLASIIKMVQNNTISGLASKQVLAECIETGIDPVVIVKNNSLEQLSDEKELEKIILKVIKENEKSVIDYKKGKVNALGFLIGQVMKQTKGKANPKVVNEMFRKELD